MDPVKVDPVKDEAVLRLRAVDVERRDPRGGRRVVLRGIDLDLRPGVLSGLVGPSGSGKSTIGRVTVGLERVTRGSVTSGGAGAQAVEFGADAGRRGRRALRRLRPRLQMVVQDPYSAFDPRLSLGRVFDDLLQRIHPDASAAERRDRAGTAFAEVGLLAVHLTRRSAQLSGGQLQRAAIARALLVEPAVLVADEVVSALDLATQVRIVDLLGQRCADADIALLFISHDLAQVADLCDDLAVLDDGELVETGTVADVLSQRRHPVTRALLDAVPRPSW